MRRRRLVPAIAAAALLLNTPAAADASTWTVGLGASSHGAAQGGSLAAPAAGISCGLFNSVTIGWNSVPHADGYQLWYSTSGSGGPYSLYTTTTSTSVTIGGLGIGSYWAEVAATAGSAPWTSPLSAPTQQATITWLVLFFCGIS